MNPLKVADDGALRSAVPISDSAASSSHPPLEDIDWMRGSLYHRDPVSPGRRLAPDSACAVVLVDTDATARNIRRAQLSDSGATRVITASDDLDVADALRLMTADAVVISASDVILSARLICAVRAQLEEQSDPLPLIIWQTRALTNGRMSALLDAGADAVLDHTSDGHDLLRTVQSLRLMMRGATRHAHREAMPASPVLDALQVGVALLDREARILEANLALQSLWREMTGHRDAPVGLELASLLVPADRSALADAVRTMLATAPGGVVDLTCTFGSSPMRGIPVTVRLTHLGGAADAPVLVAQLTDTREQRRAEEAARASRWRALDRQQTLDLAGRLRGLLSAVAQSVSPLAGVRAAGDVVLSSTHVAMLRGTLTQSEVLLDALQAIATDQEHPAALVDMRTLVETHLALFRQMLPSHVVMTWDAGAADILVRGSETQLQQVLTALVMNAWDAQRSGGAIHVVVHHTDDVVVVAVEDDGPGIPEERADWIFQPMTTTRATEGASGLGLVTSRRAVEMHGGQLRLDRFREHGARFEVILPRYRPRTQVPRVPARTQPRRTIAGL